MRLAAVLATLPVLVVQGRRVRRTTPRLPDAAGGRGLVGEGQPARHVLVVGDSMAAGVGIDHHRSTMAGELARRLAGDGAASWTVLAQTGATAGQAARLLPERVPRTDLVVVSIGVNDTKDLHTAARFRRELRVLLSRVLECGAPVVLLGVPPMEAFPALPRPLAGILGARARRLDHVGREVAAELGVAHLRIELPDRADLFAADGFHPGPLVHQRVAEAVLSQSPADRG